MNNKKKFIGSLKVFLLLLFIMLFATCSNCYATVESGDIKSYLNILSESYDGSNASSYKSYLSSMSDENINIITNYINTQLSNWGFSELDINYCILTLEPKGGDFYLHFYFCKNTVSCPYSNIGYFKIAKENDVTYLRMTGSTGDKFPYCYFNFDYYTQTINHSWKYLATYPTSLYFNDSSLSFDSDTNYLTGTAFVGTGLPIGDYELTPCYLVNSVGNYIIPSDGSGDSSGDISGDSSGDSSGDVNIDLTNIENGIDNINQNLNDIDSKIPSSGDMQVIISGEVDKINNTLTNYDEDVGEEGVVSLISNISESMSGELSSNEIFGALDTAEQGFFNIISGNGGDFELSWNDVFLYGIKLIPAGSINFSQMCRDNPALSNVKNYINIILTAFCTFGLFKYLYNLFLATLGIDNPYLYEINTDSVNLKVTNTTKYDGKVFYKNRNVIGGGRS